MRLISVFAVMACGALPIHTCPIKAQQVEIVLADTRAETTDISTTKNTVHCTNNNPIPLLDILADFDTMAANSPSGLCGGIVAPVLSVPGRQGAQASSDGNSKFYVCNYARSARCITLGADKRKQIQEAHKTCNSKPFWIAEDDQWNYGVDQIDNGECGF
jgi:hypothetical protein